MSTPPTYTRTAKIMHWLSAVLVIGVIGYGWSLDDLAGSALSEALSYHAFGGLLIMALTVLRVTWRIGHLPPDLPETVSETQRKSIKLVHRSFYALLILVPVTGLVAAVSHELPVVLFGKMDLTAAFSALSTEGFAVRRFVHVQAMHTLIALVLGHIAAALFHQFWLKDDVMRRMLRVRKV